MKKLPVAGPWITEREISYVADAAATAWYDQAGVYVERFETAFAAHLCRRFAVALPSCTAGLHLALLALGIKAGDEVIVPEATWIATCAPVVYVGATPVFADVDPATWCLTPAGVAAVATPRTKAIIAVDLYGGMPDMAVLSDIARANGIALIEDAAEAIGSTYKGAQAGSFGDMSVFSFHGSKTLTTGEGGMLVTDDAALYRRILFLRDHGRPPGDRQFVPIEVAHKYKMSALQAAIGLAQLERIEELVNQKRRIFAWYRDRLCGHNDLVLNAEPPDVYNSYWMTTVLWPAELGMSKFTLMDRLAELGVMTRPFFSPLSSLPAFANASDRDRATRSNQISYDICTRGLNLPSALCLTEADVAYACSALISELS